VTVPHHLGAAELYRIAHRAEDGPHTRMVVGAAAYRLACEQLAYQTGIPADLPIRLILLGIPTVADDELPPWGWQLERDYDGTVTAAGRFIVHDADCEVVP